MTGLSRLERDLKTLFSRTEQSQQPLSEKALEEIQIKGGDVDLLAPIFAPTTDEQGKQVPSRGALRASILARITRFSPVDGSFSKTRLKITANHLDRPGATVELGKNLKSLHEYATALLDDLTQRLGWMRNLRREDYTPEAAQRLQEQMTKLGLRKSDVAKLLQEMHQQAQAAGHWRAKLLATTFRDFFEPNAKEIQKAVRERLLGAELWHERIFDDEQLVAQNVADLQSALDTGTITPKEYDQALLTGYYNALSAKTTPAGAKLLEAEIPPGRIDATREKSSIREGLLEALREASSFHFGHQGNANKIAFLEHLSAHKNLFSEAELADALSAHIPNVLSWAHASSSNMIGEGFQDALVQAVAVVGTAKSLLETSRARRRFGDAVQKALTDLVAQYDQDNGRPEGMAAVAEAVPLLTEGVLTGKQTEQIRRSVDDGLARCAPKLLLYATWPRSGIDRKVIEPYLASGAVTPEDIRGCVDNLRTQYLAGGQRRDQAERSLEQALRLLPAEEKLDMTPLSDDGVVRFAHVDLAEVLRDPDNFDFKGETIDAIIDHALKNMGPVALEQGDVRYAVRRAIEAIRGDRGEEDAVSAGYEQAIYRAIGKATGLVLDA